jgi:sec-independent protein translocase protein TatC
VLVYPLIVLVLLTVAAFLLKEPVFDILLAPNSPNFITYSIAPGYGYSSSSGHTILNLISTELSAQFLMHMKVSFYVGLIFTLPFFFYKLFKYVSPGLYEKERRYSAQVVVFSFISFIAGIMMNYFIIFPFSLRFLAGYQVSTQVNNMISIGSYMGTLISLSIGMGVCFELPVMSWLLTKLGLLKAAFLRRYRKHAVFVILIVSAIITPTTDIFTLLLVAIPIALLYELSVIISRVSERKRESVPLNLEVQYSNQ